MWTALACCQSLSLSLPVSVCACVVVHKGGPASMTGVTKATAELVPDAEHHISTERCTSAHKKGREPDLTRSQRTGKVGM